jgi:hypothetical protein
VIFNTLDLDVRILALGTAAISVVWLIFAFLGYRAYGHNLRASFARRDWDPVALLVDDDASRAVLDRLVNSDDIRDVRLAVDVLADAESPRLAVHAIRLLSEPTPTEGCWASRRRPYSVTGRWDHKCSRSSGTGRPRRS